MAKANKKADKAAPAKAAPAKAAPAKAAAKAAPAKAAAALTSRGEMVDIVAAQTGLTKTQADGAIKAYESAIVRTLSGGGEVRLNGFGSFKTSHRAARTGRNPRTGGTVEVAARTVPRFAPSSAFKLSIAGDSGNGAKAGKGAAKAAPAKAAAKAAPAKGKKK